MAQSVKCRTSAQVMISQSVSSSPASGSVLTAQSLEPASDSVSPSFSSPPQLTLSLKKNKQTFNKQKKRLFGSGLLPESNISSLAQHTRPCTPRPLPVSPAQSGSTCTLAGTRAQELLCLDPLSPAASPSQDLHPSVCLNRNLQLLSTQKGLDKGHVCKYLTLSQAVKLKVLVLKDQVLLPGQESLHSAS